MLSNKAILLLEDDVIDVMTIKRALKQLNITNELVVKDNGETGLEYLGECEELPGFILLELTPLGFKVTRCLIVFLRITVNITFWIILGVKLNLACDFLAKGVIDKSQSHVHAC